MTNNLLFSTNMTTTPSPACPLDTEPYNGVRSVIIYFGTAVSICGTVTNSLLVLLFMGVRYRNSPMMYLGMLALLDVFLSVTYLALFTGDFIWVHLEVEWVFHLWHLYVLTAFFISKVVLFASTLLVICATIERYLLIAQITAHGTRQLYSVHGRRCIVLAVFLFTAVFMSPAYFEYDIVTIPRCRHTFAFYVWQPTPLAHNSWYRRWTDQVLPVCRVVIPFTILIAMNAAILYAMKMRMEAERRKSMFTGDVTFSGKLHRAHIRGAAITMMSLVTLYLVCNTYRLGIRIIEVTGYTAELASTESGAWFYRYATDISSVMAVLNSFLRIFIYRFGDPMVRRDLLSKAYLRSTHYKARPKNRKMSVNDRCPPRTSAPSGIANFAQMIVAVRSPTPSTTGTIVRRTSNNNLISEDKRTVDDLFAKDDAMIKRPNGVTFQ